MKNSTNQTEGFRKLLPGEVLDYDNIRESEIWGRFLYYDLSGDLINTPIQIKFHHTRPIYDEISGKLTGNYDFTDGCFSNPESAPVTLYTSNIELFNLRVQLCGKHEIIFSTRREDILLRENKYGKPILQEYWDMEYIN